MRIKSLLAGILLLFLTGCITSNLDMNYQRSLTRGAGDLTSTVWLKHEFGGVDKEKIIETATKVIKVLNAYDLEGIERDGLVLLLEQHIPNDAMKKIARKAVDKIPQDIDLQKGKIIAIAFCKGLIVGASEFKPSEDQ